MIIYFNHHKSFQCGESIQLKYGSKATTQKPSEDHYAIAVRCKVFNPVCNDHLHQLIEVRDNVRIARIQSTEDNTEQIFNESLHDALVSLGFGAAIYYKNHNAFLFFLDDVYCQVLGRFEKTYEPNLN